MSDLEILSIQEAIDNIKNAPPRRFLFRPIWPERAYGVFAAPDKAGKTWALGDAAVSVASGTPWLGAYPVDGYGPVLLFLGEGGMESAVRRLNAIANARELDLDDLPIRICTRVPHLSNEEHLKQIARELEEHPAVFVGIDPFYLSARGAKPSSIFDMGEVLESVQLLVQDAGAALMVVHHWNKGGDGDGHERMSGVGPGAWGRVLISAKVEARKTEANGASAVVLSLKIIGGEISDAALRIRRRVWAEDPDDLASALHYEVEQLEAVAAEESDPATVGLSPADRRVLAALAASEISMTVRQIGDAVAKDLTTGQGLKPRTIQNSLKILSERGLAKNVADADAILGEWISLSGLDRAQAEEAHAHLYAHPDGAQGGPMELIRYAF